MCGIAGLWNVDGEPVDAVLLRQMTDSLAHRGPDGGAGLLVDSHGKHANVALNGMATAGVAADHDLGLGHRRLAIIDLATGDQPMSTPDGSLWIVFNGEIYNYRELREELRGRGCRFTTESDTEVILQAYRAYGRACAARLNGIFAFALWDAAQQQLLLARDHFGVKPLYYSWHGSSLRFASELKAILVDPGVRRELDLNALNLCLTFRHTPSPSTMFQGIRKLAPASYAVVTRDGMRTTRYWDSAPATATDCQPQDLVEALAGRLDAAVHRQMVSDVPLSLSLSSGVDSSVLLAIMARHSAEPVHTFTVGFAGQNGSSEIAPAAQTARHFGAHATSQVISQDDYSAFMHQYMWHLEEPIGNDSAPAYYFVARLAKAAGIKVMLNGQGADEVFAGYGRHLGAVLGGWLAPFSSPPWRTLMRRAARGVQMSQGAARLACALAEGTEIDQLLSIYSFLSPEIRRRLLSPETREQVDPEAPRAYIADQLARAPRGTRLERMLWVDTRTSLPDDLLLCEDKMAMAASVEARVPFLDVELMALAERIPGSLKQRWGQGKWIHRRVCARFVPPEVVRRPKIGFDNALDVWLRAHLGNELRRLVEAPNSMTRTYLCRATVEHLLAEHASGRRDHRRILFLLLSMETWHSMFFGRSGGQVG